MIRVRDLQYSYARANESALHGLDFDVEDGEGSGSRQRSDRGWLAPRSPVIGLAFTDLRNWVRDPMLLIAAVGPLVLAVFIRFGAPTVADMATPVFALSSYYPVIAGAMAVFGPSLYGFIVGMFVLEDREQGVLSAYRVSPLSPRGYLLYRGATAYALSLLATLPALAAIGLVPVPPAILIGTAIVGALGGPVLTLAFGTLASNSIEGLALSKLVNVVVLAPAVVIAVVPEPFQFAAGVLPTYWPVKLFVAGTTSEPVWPLYLFVGVVVHLFALAWLGQKFARQAD